ncbi:uncharacterized protein LOC113387855 [Ctenocephalides felis]|uniref:uncharacterized protein LOC113387844 n=1 Tax=Ctenocephalides felis TaxID=7515 RepID=UPI000E6E448B|nr:uncharacterized protein LOC113387844 [Ctenocephalides felis]XP_026481026.1 uncharacterized protein LOC113387855 [Ctenocephalides felis]
MATSKVSLKFLQELIKHTDPDVTLMDYQESPGSVRGDNYTAMLYRVRLEGTRVLPGLQNVPWRRYIIYKCLPDSAARRDAFRSVELFFNEVAFYNRILPAMMRFQEKFLIDDGRRFTSVPKCYLARNDIVVLEDLKHRGFKMVDRKLGLTVVQCSAILKELARYHALSLAMKHHFPEEVDQLRQTIAEGMFANENKEWYSGYYEAATKNAVAMVREALSNKDSCSKYLDRFRAFVETSDESSFFDRMVDLVAPREPLAVFCHGDCWTNNIMFKCSDAGNILEICLLDFQMVRYGSLALDLANLLYICTSSTLRSKHLQNLLREYHNELFSTLSEMGPLSDLLQNSDALWNALQEEFHRCGLFGLGLALDMLPIMTCDSDDAPDLYISDEEAQYDPIVPVSANSHCREKMAELVVELVNNNVL